MLPNYNWLCEGLWCSMMIQWFPFHHGMARLGAGAPAEYGVTGPMPAGRSLGNIIRM